MSALVAAALLLTGGLIGPRRDRAGGPDAGTGNTPTVEFGPIAELRRSDDELRQTLHRVVPEWSPEYDLQKHAIHRLASYLLDVDQFSRLALSEHWDRLSLTQRGQFISLLGALIERSYIPRLNRDPHYRVTYQREVIDGTSAHVFGTITSRHNDVVTTTSVKYDLVEKDHHWVVYDITTDGQSLLESYREQFDTIIRKQSIDALMEKMRRKAASCCGD